MKAQVKAVCAALALTFAASAAPVFAQDRHVPPPQRHGDRFDRHDRRDHDDGHRRNDRDYVRQGHWERGQRLPAQYRGRQYVVDNWRAHGLKAPPRGHQWVQSGGDYLLIAVATGIIAQVLLGR
jgi:Ni/Co efflux regulator RcnB